MKRFFLTTATAALIPLAALADNHQNAADDTMKKMDDTAQTAVDSAADGGMNPDVPAVAENTDPVVGSDVATMAKAEESTDAAGLGVSGMVPVSAITGGQIYTTSADTEDSGWLTTDSYDKIGEGWEQIGSIHDVVLSADGKLEGIVAEVGGFLGIGDKLVLLPLSDMKLVPMEGDNYAAVTPFTTDQLTDMDSFVAAQ